MQCEFSKAELIRLELAVMDRLMNAKLKLPPEGNGTTLQEQNAEQLEGLYKKLDRLIEQAENMLP